MADTNKKPISPELWERLQRETKEITDREYAKVQAMFGDGLVAGLQKIAFTSVMEQLSGFSTKVQKAIISMLQSQLDYAEKMEAEFPDVDWTKLDPSIPQPEPQAAGKDPFDDLSFEGQPNAPVIDA